MRHLLIPLLVHVLLARNIVSDWITRHTFGNSRNLRISAVDSSLKLFAMEWDSLAPAALHGQLAAGDRSNRTLILNRTRLEE
jgi:hypothetical protein